MEILMSKEPSYVRCIKPNDAKQPGTLNHVRSTPLYIAVQFQSNKNQSLSEEHV